MRLTFLGAAGEVTGSCYLLETGAARVMIDFGLHQGGALAERRNRRPPPIDAGRLDAVLLTHAHLDHCGRLPLLARTAFNAPIFCTPATRDLCHVMLRDAAHVQQSDAERVNRRRQRRARPPEPPLYTAAEAEAILPRLAPTPYESPLEVAPGVTARFVDAGHIIGSASVEVTAVSQGGRKVIVFSGDVGPSAAPLLNDPTPMREADIVVMESTYGDRDHRPIGATLEELAGILAGARLDGGRVLIPAFAVGRTQNLIHYFGGMEASGVLAGVPVYIDSPMASEVTALYVMHHDLLNEASRTAVRGGVPPLGFRGLRFTASAQESAALNTATGPAVIIAASGMCTGGRILHHLKHNLWKPETRVVFTGYQAEGTLGRRLVDGARMVKVMEEPIAVRASIHTLGGFSAHAGRTGLIEWASALAPARPRFYLTHGEARARDPLAAALRERFRLEVSRPGFGEAVEL